MENMKRAISAFMALVLVLGMMPGVPMFAGAEEVETQPETVAVESTAAVTVPEETEAPETIAAETEAPETVPETTAAAETVPQETVSEEVAGVETLPQETVAEETVPEETVAEETIPEETVPEITEEAADANDTVVLTQKIEISASKDRTYVGDDVKLTAVITPSNVTETKVSWVVESGNVNATALEKGYLRANEAGTVTVHAEAIDGSTIISDPITVEFVNYKMEINETPIPDENIFEGQYVLQTGNTLPISVAYLTWTAEESEDEAKVELPLHTPSLEWTLEGDSEKYAELTVNPSNPKEVTVKAKLVTEYQTITVKVRDTVIGYSDTISIRLYPDSYKVYITDENGKDVTNGTIVLDLAAGESEVTLNAMIWPVEGDEDLVWSTSDTLVELEDLDGEEETANKSMKLTADQRTGETVVKVQAAEHSDVYSTVTIKRMRLIQAIGPTRESSELQQKELVAGKSAKLQAVDLADREILDNKLLKWEIAEGDEAYASITSDGVLKAKNVTIGKVITVKCSVIDNEDDAKFELYIPIRPKASSVKILSDTFVGGGETRMVMPGEVINGKTVIVDTEEYVPAVPAFLVEHYAEEYTGAGDPVGAKQEVTWKSSNTAVAAIDPLTDELVWKGKNGTTTITATAKDGSGKSASVKVQFGTKLRSLEFNDQEGMFLRSGSSWTFSLTFTPENASNKTVNWAVYQVTDGGELANASSIATISSSGKLTAKTVYDNHLVRVFATAKEDASVSAYFDVLIRPKKDYALTLLDDNDNCVTKTTIQLDVGQSVSLSAVLVGEELDEYYDAAAEWKSSNKSVAEVDDGYVDALKAGTSTITAIGQDGQKATVTIKIVSQVDYIEIYQKNNIEVLGSGKSLELKADVYDFDTATDKNPKGKPGVSKVRWFIGEGGEQYATVSSAGKVTAVKGYDGAPVSVDVYAMATDGSEVCSDPYTITIFPVVESMRIDIDAVPNTTSSYTYYMLESGESVGKLTAVTFPEYASDDVTWKSSNKTIADVDEDGNVTAYKAGSVTITATATDGSGKKATFKLTIVSKAAYVGLDNQKNMIFDAERGEWLCAIAGGKTLTLKPVFFNANDKKMSVAVEWEIDKIYDDYGTAFVKKFSKGVVTTEKVTEPKFTTVTIKVPGAYADGTLGVVGEDGFVRLTITVGVYPATTSLQITENDKVVNSSLWRRVDCEPIQLGVETNYGAAPGWDWKSSNEKIAWVDPDTGEVYSTGKAGTVTITATAKDGTGKRDSIKIVFAK